MTITAMVPMVINIVTVPRVNDNITTITETVDTTSVVSNPTTTTLATIDTSSVVMLQQEQIARNFGERSTCVVSK